MGDWTVRGAVEPETDWYGKRPANLNSADPKLCAQQYVFSMGVEYAWTQSVHVLCTSSIERQDTNADTAEPTLNSFTDCTNTVGFSISF
jgi:hypothetical protein